MATRMQQRRGTASQWTTANPILNAGEIGWESDTNKFKIGDGVNHWADLIYFVDGAELSNIIDGAPDLLNTLNELAAAINDDPSFFTTVATNLSNHESDTTNIHGITDTAELATKTFAANLLVNATKSNITISGDKNGLTITAENGVADSTTDNLTEGSTNKYFTDERAQDAVGNNVGTGLTYTDSTGEIKVTPNTYDAYGAASTVAGDLSTHMSDTTTHGTTGDIVGTSDTQTLTNKTLTSPKINENVILTASATELNILDGATLSTTELNYVDGVTSAIQTQLDAKAPLASPTFTGTVNAASLTLSGNLTVQGTTTTVSSTNLEITDPLIYIGQGNSANLNDLGVVGHFDDGTYQHTGLVRDASDGKWKLFSGVTTEPTGTIDFTTYTKDTLVIGALEATSLTVGSVSNTEFGYLDGVTSAIQTQIDSKLSTSTASSTYAPIESPTFTGTVSGITKSMVGLGNVENTALSTWAGTSSITTLGTIATGTWNGTTIAIANGGTGATSASAARTALGLAIGTDVQAYNSSLAAIAGGTYTGATSITTLGTIATGVWSGTAIATTKGGTGLTSYTAGDILYASGSNTLAALAKGTDGQILTLASGVPSWAAAPASGPTTIEIVMGVY